MNTKRIVRGIVAVVVAGGAFAGLSAMGGEQVGEHDAVSVDPLGSVSVALRDGSVAQVAAGSMSPCEDEDSANACVWSARDRGNGEGGSFVVVNGQRVAVSTEVARGLVR